MASTGGRCSKKSRCLLCEGQMRRSGSCSLRHIQEHLQYKKYTCQGCAYRCSTEDASMVHKWKSGHRMVSRENDYLEMLSSKIYMDCLHAADFGIEPVLSAMRNDSFNRSRIVEQARSSKAEGGSGDVVEVNVAERSTAAGLIVKGREKEHGGGTELSDKEQGCRLHDSREITPDTTDEPPPVQTIGSGARTNSESAMGGMVTEFADSTRVDETCSASRKNKRRRQSSSEREIPTEQASESHNIDITCRNESTAERALIDAGLKTDNPKKVSCRKCGKAVASDYAHRRRHVTKHHHSDVAEKDFDEILASEVRTCFPGCLVYSDIQCNECGREYKSESGRKYHAIRYHMQRMLKCVIHGCNVQEQSPAALKVHIQNDHQMAISSESNADVFRVFLCAKKKFDAALAAEVLRCFPIDLRSRTSNPLVPSPVNNDEDLSPRPSAPLIPASANDEDTRTAPDIDSTAFVSPVHPVTGSLSATMRNNASVTRATVCTEQNGPRCESRKRNESSSSSSDDSDSRRYAEAMRNRGRSDNASSPSPADDSALLSGCSLSKTTPPQASQHQTPSSSTTAPATGPPHPQALVTPTLQTVARPLPSQSAMKRATPQREYQKRRVLLPLDEPQRGLMQQSRVAVDFSNIPRQYLTSSDAVDGLGTSDIRRSLVWEGVVNSSLSSRSGCAHNPYERFDARPFEWSLYGDTRDSSMCACSNSNERYGNIPNEKRTFDRLPPARNRTFPPARKKQSHRGDRSIRRDRGGLIVRSRGNKLEGAHKSLKKCKRLSGGGVRRRDASGNSMCGSSADRTSKKTAKRSSITSKKKQLAKKKAAKAIFPHASFADTSGGVTGEGGRRSNTSSSPPVSKIRSEKWSGKRQQLGNQGGDKPVGSKTEYREWHVKEEL